MLVTIEQTAQEAGASEVLHGGRHAGMQGVYKARAVTPVLPGEGATSLTKPSLERAVLTGSRGPEAGWLYPASSCLPLPCIAMHCLKLPLHYLALPAASLCDNALLSLPANKPATRRLTSHSKAAAAATCEAPGQCEVTHVTGAELAGNQGRGND